jgi:signal transduction histidine kinase
VNDTQAAAPPGGLDDGELAPALVHELRQPLMGIQAGLTLLARRLGPALSTLDDYRLVAGQVSRIEELLRGYEEFLRPERAVERPYPVVPVVARALDLLAWRLDPLGPRFEFAAGSPSLQGWGTASGLLHATTNLVVNAVDAVEEAGGAARLAVRVLGSPDGGPIEVRVSDEGPGVPEAVRTRLFEARFTTKAVGKGTGLGLHIARRLMSRSGGGVWLVDDADPARLPWARTEFRIGIARPPEPAR